MSNRHGFFLYIWIMTRIREFVTGRYSVETQVVTPYQHRLDVQGDKVGIVALASNTYVSKGLEDYSEWLDPTGTPYVSLDALITDLRTFFFTITPSGGGGDSLIPLDQRVNTFADLPNATTNAGKYYLVDTATGTWILGTRKEAGIYKAVGGTWLYRGADVPYYFTDDNLTFKDGTDQTKELGFQLDGITTGTRRTATFPNKNGTVAFLDDVTGSSLTADELAAVNNANAPTALNPFATGIDLLSKIQAFTESLSFVNGKSVYVYREYDGTEGSISFAILAAQTATIQSFLQLTIKGDGVNDITNTLPMPYLPDGVTLDELDKNSINYYFAMYTPQLGMDTIEKMVLVSLRKVALDVIIAAIAIVDFEGDYVNNITAVTLTTNSMTLNTANPLDTAGVFTATAARVTLDITMTASYTKIVKVNSPFSTNGNLISHNGTGAGHAFWCSSSGSKTLAMGNSGLSDLSSSGALSDCVNVDCWLVCKFDAGVGTIYKKVGGVFSVVATGAVAGVATGGGINLGIYQTTSSTRLNGLMYYAELRDYAMDQADIETFIIDYDSTH